MEIGKTRISEENIGEEAWKSCLVKGRRVAWLDREASVENPRKYQELLTNGSIDLFFAFGFGVGDSVV
jgi:hypothetical protein